MGWLNRHIVFGLLFLHAHYFVTGEKPLSLLDGNSSRSLVGEKRELVGEVCKECTGLVKCSILNGRFMEDFYYPSLSTTSGSCQNLEDRLSRVEYFGGDQTFKDSDECRQLVYDYTCLRWAAANNPCDNAPLTPCRSFCTEVADKCANSPHWGLLCYDIVCPPTGMSDNLCTPGDTTDLDEEDACLVFEYHTPCKDLCAAPSRLPVAHLVYIVLPAIVVIMATRSFLNL